jgi:hypothetical protein
MREESEMGPQQTRDRGGRRLRVLAGVALLGAFLLFVGTFLAVAHMRAIPDSVPGCQLNACGISNDPHREEIFYRGMGLTLLVLTGGIGLRLMASRGTRD